MVSLSFHDETVDERGTEVSGYAMRGHLPTLKETVEIRGSHPLRDETAQRMGHPRLWVV